MKRYTEMMSHHKRQKDCAGRFDVFGNVERDAQRYGRNSSFFNDALHERDALMADRSRRSKQHDVRFFRFDRIGNIFGERFFQSFRIHIVADKRVKILRQTADKIFFC